MVFFSTFFYLFRHYSIFFVPKCILQETLGSFYFFAHNCEICFIRGPPVLFERKKSNRTEECKVNFTPKKIFILENGKHKEITYQEFLKLKYDKKAFGNRKFVGVHGMIFEAEEKLYRKFYAYKRRLLYIAETAEEENIEELSYDALTTAEFNGENIIVDAEQDFTEELELRIMTEKLHKCIDLLSPREKELIQAIYFQGLSERDFAKIEGVSQNAINKRKKRILAKLKIFLEK